MAAAALDGDLGSWTKPIWVERTSSEHFLQRNTKIQSHIQHNNVANSNTHDGWLSLGNTTRIALHGTAVAVWNRGPAKGHHDHGHVHDPGSRVDQVTQRSSPLSSLLAWYAAPIQSM